MAFNTVFLLNNIVMQHTVLMVTVTVFKQLINKQNVAYEKCTKFEVYC